MEAGDIWTPLKDPRHGVGGAAIPSPPPLPKRLPTARKYARRVKTFEFGNPVQKAAALIDLVVDDEAGIPDQIINSPRFEMAIRYHLTYVQCYWLWNPNIFAMLLLNFFEKPLWCVKYGKHSCVEKAFYFLGVLPYLSDTALLVCEVFTWTILALYILYPISYEGLELWSKNGINRLKVALFLVLGCDIVVYTCSHLPFRVAPYIRVVFFMLTIREMRNGVATVGGILQTYLNVVALWSMFILFSSWLGYVAFEDTLQGKIRFTSFGSTLYQMFVLFTTANNPDAWLNAYKESRWSFAFFLLYLMVGLYFVMTLTLAVIYDSFKKQLVKRIQERDMTRKAILDKAFRLITNADYITREQCRSLFDELSKFRTLPKILRENFDYLFAKLDENNDSKIEICEFEGLCRALEDKYQDVARPSFLEKYPFYHSPQCDRVKTFLLSDQFDHIILFILSLNMIAVMIETTIDIWNSSAQSFWQKVELFFGLIYMLEMVMKIFSSGFHAYWRKGRHKFDFVITWTTFIGEAITFAFSFVLPFLSSGDWTRFLIIGRIIRSTRILLFIPSFRAFVATFLTVVPSVMPYAGIIFCIHCFYCSLGMQLFGGLVNSGNPALPETELYVNDYLIYNFNDFSNGMVVLFNMQVVNNWYIWMSSYWHLTGTSWSLVYFVSFYLIDVLLLLNMIVAFVLDTFFAEEGVKKHKKHLSIRGGKLIRVRSSNNMDHILHHMLSEQLNESRSGYAVGEEPSPSFNSTASMQQGEREERSAAAYRDRSSVSQPNLLPGSNA